MGFFSGDKEISVSSVVYNLAGVEENRPDYLKNLVTRNILSGTKDSMAQTFQNGVMRGPALHFRSFYRWAEKSDNFGTIGMPIGSSLAGSILSPSKVTPEIPHDTTETVWVQRATLEDAAYLYWAERWMLDNRPSLYESGWTARINNTTKVITITFADGTTASFTASGFNLKYKYIYAYYTLITAGVYGPLKLFIYRIGSGNPDLDVLVNKVKDYGQFFPIIPVRLSNQFLSDSFLPTAFEQCSKAYKKATGSSLDDLIDKISDNPKLEDIDHTFVHFGVSLNVLDNSCRKYLYKFFENLQANQVGGANIYEQWKLQTANQDGVWQTWQAWKTAQADTDDPLYGTPEPVRPAYTTLPNNMIQVTTEGSVLANEGIDIRISWVYIANGQGTGKAKTSAKVNEVWFQVMGTDTFAQSVLANSDSYYSGSQSIDKIRLYWQRTATSYTYLDIVGLVHNNVIYSGQGVITTAAKALADTDESGFIVPLHYDTYRELALMDASQMGTACVFVVFNCYKIVKQKWYQSGFFSIIVVIVVAIISAVVTGGASVGLLGTALSVGTSMGLTGMTAAIVGSVVNALAALVLSTFVSQLATGIFGEQIGGLIASLFMMVVGSVAGSIATTGTFSLDWGNLLSAENLLKLTNAVGNSVIAGINADTMQIGQDMQDYAQQSKAEAEKIQQAFFDQFGYGAGQINPLMFVNSTKILAESSDTFLTRTLMTGSEIAELSRDLLYNFSEYSMKLPDAYT